MRAFSFTRRVPYSPGQMFDLVADLAAYPDFVPNCADMAVTAEGDDTRLARMTVSFGPVTQAYTSRVALDRSAGTITAKAVDGPFSRLDSQWRFDADGEGCAVSFSAEFEIANPLIAAVAEPAFAAKQQEIAEAFVSEAERRYG